MGRGTLRAAIVGLVTSIRTWPKSSAYDERLVATVLSGDRSLNVQLDGSEGIEENDLVVVIGEMGFSKGGPFFASSGCRLSSVNDLAYFGIDAASILRMPRMADGAGSEKGKGGGSV